MSKWPALPWWVALLMYCALAVALQAAWTGAFQSELGAYPDEPAHYVTGVLGRDYIADGLPGSALGFAERFYSRFPKVALGNWPPGFYLLQLPWLWIVGDDPVSVVALDAVLIGATAGLVAWLAAQLVPWPLALLTGLWWLLLPLSVALGGTVMTEPALALATAAVLAMAVRLEAKPTAARQLALGALLGAGVLIKGVLLALLLLPASWLRRGGRGPGLTAGAVPLAIAAVLSGPWTVYFREQARAGWMYPAPTPRFTIAALGAYPPWLAQVLGWTVLLGLAAWLVAALRTRRLAPVERLAALAAGALMALLLVVPAGYEPRHLLPVTVPVVVLAAGGLATLWRATSRRALAASALVVLAAVELAVARERPTRRWAGYGEVFAAARQACPAARPCRVLIVSDSQGEGAFVAEATRWRGDHGLAVLRGSQLLSSSTWSGRDYVPRAPAGPDGIQVLRGAGVDVVVVEDDTADDRDASIARAIVSAAGWSAAAEFHVVRELRHPGAVESRRDRVALYRVPWAGNDAAQR